MRAGDMASRFAPFVGNRIGLKLTFALGATISFARILFRLVLQFRVKGNKERFHLMQGSPRTQLRLFMDSSR
jgi:hypothetical protein